MLADKDIQTRLKEGSKEVFRKLFCHYYPRLRAYVTTIVNEDMVAEDVVQDTFLYLWEHHSEISMNDDIQSYLYRSAYTRCVDYFRKLQQEDQYSASVYEAYAEECETLLEQEGAALEDLYTQDFYQELYHLLQQIHRNFPYLKLRLPDCCKRRIDHSCYIYIVVPGNTQLRRNMYVKP